MKTYKTLVNIYQNLLDKKKLELNIMQTKYNALNVSLTQQFSTNTSYYMDASHLNTQKIKRQMYEANRNIQKLKTEIQETFQEKRKIEKALEKQVQKIRSNEMKKEIARENNIATINYCNDKKGSIE